MVSHRVVVDPLAVRTPLGLRGAHQLGNAALAAATAESLGASEPAIRAGLARARWPGRYEIVGAAPWVVLDGAHDGISPRALAREPGAGARR